jgi:hypothetical protein
MFLSVCIVHYLKVDEETMRIWSEILQAEATLLRTIFNHYRPELHYMRGPGPKWLEKHGSRSVSPGEASPNRRCDVSDIGSA